MDLDFKSLSVLLRVLPKRLRFTARKTKSMLLKNPLIDERGIARFLLARKRAEEWCKVFIATAKSEIYSIHYDVCEHVISVDDAAMLLEMLNNAYDDMNMALSSISNATSEIKDSTDSSDIQETIEFVEFESHQANNASHDATMVIKRHYDLKK